MRFEDVGDTPEPQAARVVAPPRTEPDPIVPEGTKYATYQEIAPIIIGLIRSFRLAIYGAVGGLGVGLKMGARDWDDLLWGALIGACFGFVGRTEEAATMDQPKTTSVTEKV